MRTCMYVRSHISKTTCPSFTKFSLRVTRSRGSVLPRQRSNKLCISGSVDEVMFSHNGAYNSNEVWLLMRTMRNERIRHICKSNALDRVEISSREGAILRVVWTNQNHWESVLRVLRSKKINNDDSGTSAAGKCKCKCKCTPSNV